MNELGYKQLDNIAHRFDILLDKTKNILPPAILDESKILQLMFGDRSSPERLLATTYLRLEPLLRWLEFELIPAVEEEEIKKEAKSAKQSTKATATERQKVVA